MTTWVACCIWVLMWRRAFLTPILECRAVIVPPALTPIMQILMSFRAGAQPGQHTSHAARSIEHAARFTFSIASRRRCLSAALRVPSRRACWPDWATPLSPVLTLAKLAYELHPKRRLPITTAFMTALSLDRGISKLLASFATSFCDPERRKVYIVRHQWPITI
jgi:hypothetical protein